MDPRFKHPFTCVLAGPSGSGKTTFIYKLITNVERLITPPPDEIIYCYSEWQPMYQELQEKFNVLFFEGLPDTDSFTPDRVRLIIIDDLMNEVNEKVTRLFTKESHHRGVSVIHITQNLFSKHKEQRTITLNTHYIVLFKNPRDVSQITHLASQMYPGKGVYMKEAYKLSTTKPFGYLLVDLKQDTPDEMRLRSDIFSTTKQVVFLQK